MEEIGEITVKTMKNKEFFDITSKVNERINFEKGFLYLFVPHTTCALALQEFYDGSVEEDFLDLAEKIFKLKKQYKHDLIDNNATAHIASMFLSPYLILPVAKGKLDLGTWQRIVFFEFDGPRQRVVRLYKL